MKSIIHKMNYYDNYTYYFISINNERNNYVVDTLQNTDNQVVNITTFNDYSVNKLQEQGYPVEQGYEYNSYNNSHFLSVDEIKAMS